ncbi:MAG: hypothetical protein IKE02_03910 [Lachnospiraceae bacterium]|nr:hypothetical protein [Lachnospiraceae bacterium]
MSGGSMDYACFKVREIADMEEDLVIKSLLKDLADYLHAEEWYLSGDTGRDSYIEKRKAFKEKWFGKPIDMKPYVDDEINAFKRKIYQLIGAEWKEE